MAESEHKQYGDVEGLTDTLRKRTPFLELLADTSLDQRDLRDELGFSRSTVYKALQELADAGLVTEYDGEYALTGFGRLAWQRHDEYVARLSRLDAGRRLIETLPDDRQFPPALFERARIITSGRHAPERPLDRLSDAGGQVDHLRVASPSGIPRFLADLHANVEAGEQAVKIVVETDALSRLRSAYDRFDKAAAADGLEIHHIDRQLEFAIVLFDDEEIGLFGYDSGALVGAAFTTDDAAIRWGQRLFDRLVEQSVEI
jgi:predicted transcriptional regulator